VLEYLAPEASVYGINLSATQLEQFGRYLDLLSDWSQRVNLVANADPDVVARRHVLESIALGAALREREILRPDMRVLDIGAGAGFPGLVLKIVWPSIALTLIEATAKKTAFLSAVTDALELDNNAVVTGRAESLGHDVTLRGTFDLVVARAVASLPVLLELALPFARVGGRVASPKGSRANHEIAAASNALSVLGGKLFSMPLRISGPPQTLVVVAKQRETPPEYPRRPGVPTKSPL
jgi:16S rRNA (guanine527-N7)-methyltransferase